MAVLQQCILRRYKYLFFFSLYLKCRKPESFIKLKVSTLTGKSDILNIDPLLKSHLDLSFFWSSYNWQESRLTAFGSHTRSDTWYISEMS